MHITSDSKQHLFINNSFLQYCHAPLPHPTPLSPVLVQQPNRVDLILTTLLTPYVVSTTSLYVVLSLLLLILIIII